jgi:hypothetical protein
LATTYITATTTLCVHVIVNHRQVIELTLLARHLQVVLEAGLDELLQHELLLLTQPARLDHAQILLDVSVLALELLFVGSRQMTEDLL